MPCFTAFIPLNYAHRLCRMVPTTHFLPPPTPSLMYRLMWALWGVAMTYTMWLGYMWRICRLYRVLRLWDAYVLYSLWRIYGMYMGCIWENRVTEDSAGGGPCVRRAPPPALPCRTVNKILP